MEYKSVNDEVGRDSKRNHMQFFLVLMKVAKERKTAPWIFRSLRYLMAWQATSVKNETGFKTLSSLLDEHSLRLGPDMILAYFLGRTMPDYLTIEEKIVSVGKKLILDLLKASAAKEKDSNRSAASSTTASSTSASSTTTPRGVLDSSSSDDEDSSSGSDDESTVVDPPSMRTATTSTTTASTVAIRDEQPQERSRRVRWVNPLVAAFIATERRAIEARETLVVHDELRREGYTRAQVEEESEDESDASEEDL